MKISSLDRNKFKTPLGKVFPNSSHLKQIILKEITGHHTITVGDATSEKITSYGVSPLLQIVDGLEQRRKRDLPLDESIKTILHCTNPASEITDNSVDAIRLAFDSLPPVRILVKGEEDLLVLPVCIYAPDNSIVMYGQPNEGLVLVHINDKTRDKVKFLLDLMI